MKEKSMYVLYKNNKKKKLNKIKKKVNKKRRARWRRKTTQKSINSESVD